ncbi:MAG TPA: gluconeogenesis factor YvcK family protein [Terriglobales bacterium]|nr:gluconeogenesis factor YvcK family protein [Terriglobales bacterium]
MSELSPESLVSPDHAPDCAFRVVAIGGGTGLSTLLSGLKRYVKPGAERTKSPVLSDLSAVVTVTDDGGSSGLLRKEFNILPPGDIRNCIVALSEDEALLARLFQFRFPAESALNGHNFGNLFLTALTAMTGDFAEAVKLSAEVLATRGRIFPSTTANVQLEALMNDGSHVFGETNITASTKRIVELQMVPTDAKPLPETLEAIARADLITIGPGSLFTSLIPNLLVHGIPEAIAASKAVKVFVCNLMTEANESLGLTAAGHLRAIEAHAGRNIFDYALVNATPVSRATRAKYAQEAAEQIVADVDAIEALGVKPIVGDYLDETGVARHATGRVAKDLIQLVADVTGRASLARVHAAHGDE